MRCLSLSVTILLAFSIAPAARTADGACARRAAALHGLFAAANAGEPNGAVRAPLEAALAAASEDHAADRCAPLELAVDELWVRAGGTLTVPGGTHIVAANGAAVLGRLAVRGASGVTLTATLGNLVLEGAVDAPSVRLEARSGNVHVGSRFAAPPGSHFDVAATAGAIVFAPRAVGAPDPFPPGTDLVAFHPISAVPRTGETEVTGR
jgi:hypothetical protein